MAFPHGFIKYQYTATFNNGNKNFPALSRQTRKTSCHQVSMIYIPLFKTFDLVAALSISYQK